jgi:acyl dehydratase
LANGIVSLDGEISWPLPISLGDVLHVESEVVEVTASRSKPQQEIVTVQNTALNQNGEAVYLLTAKLLVPRRPCNPRLDDAIASNQALSWPLSC